MRRVICYVWLLVAAAVLLRAQSGALAAPGAFRFVFTADAHYGITRASFRGASNVGGHAVNQALVANMNTLGRATFPSDGGVDAGNPVGAIDFLVVGGDIANREEMAEGSNVFYQTATESWRQFSEDYLDGVTLRDPSGRRSSVYVIPGNHEASNAVGYWHQMLPPTDPDALVAIYNLMLRPPTHKTPATFNYDRDRVLATRDVAGVHLVFLHVWPDSRARAWMERDLERLPATTPVVVFVHDQPDVEARHFTNPNGRHDVNATDKFENLLSDQLADGSTTDAATVIEQGALEDFISHHSNIAAYFHGNSNWNEFYDWYGPHGLIALHTFRVDSPMKGKESAADETRLSFQVASVDMSSGRMTVRECLWNTDPSHAGGALVWADSRTISITPRQVASALLTR